MKNVYILSLIACLVVLSSCGKKDTPEVEVTPVETPSLEETAQEVNDINYESEEIAEEDIVPTYTAFNGDQSSGTDEKILFFYSDSCETCKEADQNIASEQSLEIFSDIVKVNFDTEIKLNDTYEVTAAHTFVLIDENQNMIKKIEGAMNSSELTALYE